ncbi:MAG: prolyl oligopeptidase family serine peptidase [Pirellulaceae bacterium]
MNFRSLTTITLLLLICQLMVVTSPLAAENFPGKESNWHGYQRFDFVFKQRRCTVVTPQKAASGNPWIWRARFFGHQPQADLALLKHGFHVAYCDVANLFGNAAAVGHWNDFYDYLTSKHHFSRKVALEGMSRGGLIIYNWAYHNAEKVTCIYGDAPVCDIKSWPGGKGTGKGSPGTWKTCLKAHGLTEAGALEFKGNPIDHLKPLADKKVPLLHVVGASDQVVPVAENTAILQQRFEQLGGKIQVISKPGIGHHPHSLKDPDKIVQFVLQNTPQAVP